MQRLKDCAEENNIAVCLGFSENDNNSLYIAQAIISNDGSLVMTRRKLKPTHMERTVFGDATGNTLKNVVDVEGVGKVGALACWEHAQPLLKYHTVGLGEEVHVAAWPPVHEHPGGPTLWSMSRDGKSTSRSDRMIINADCLSKDVGICPRHMRLNLKPLYSTLPH